MNDIELFDCDGNNPCLLGINITFKLCIKWTILILILILIILIIIIIIIIIIALTHSNTILENTVEVALQPVALYLKNLSEYSSPSK